MRGTCKHSMSPSQFLIMSDSTESDTSWCWRRLQHQDLHSICWLKSGRHLQTQSIQKRHKQICHMLSHSIIQGVIQILVLKEHLCAEIWIKHYFFLLLISFYIKNMPLLLFYIACYYFATKEFFLNSFKNNKLTELQ